MSDEVRNAASIGAAINKGLGSIPVPRQKKPKGTGDKDKGVKKVKSTRANEEPSEKKDKNIIDAVVVEPTVIKSERLNSPKELTMGQKQLPYNPNMGAQFKGYQGTYGSTHTQPPIDLSKF